MTLHKETWLKLTQTTSVQLAVVAVQDGKVLVNQSSLDILFSGVPGEVDTEEETWTITYELMAELLSGQGFRKWESHDEGNT